MSDIRTLPPPSVDPRPPAGNKWEREYQAFLRLLPQLLKTHKSEFVAIHDEKVIDSGEDPIALIKRVHSRVGYVPIHVDQVVEQPPAPIRIPHYREFRPKGKE